VAPPGESNQSYFAFDDRYGHFSILSRTSLTRLLNKIDSSGVLKDGKIRSLPEYQETVLIVVGDLMCSEAWWKVCLASGVSER